MRTKLFFIVLSILLISFTGESLSAQNRIKKVKAVSADEFLNSTRWSEIAPILESEKYSLHLPEEQFQTLEPMSK